MAGRMGEGYFNGLTSLSVSRHVKNRNSLFDKKEILCGLVEKNEELLNKGMTTRLKPPLFCFVIPSPSPPFIFLMLTCPCLIPGFWLRPSLVDRGRQIIRLTAYRIVIDCLSTNFDLVVGIKFYSESRIGN